MYFGFYMSKSVSDMSVCFPEINNQFHCPPIRLVKSCIHFFSLKINT